MQSRRKMLQLVFLGTTALTLPSRAFGGTVAGFGGSTEFTQIANNIQLLGNVGNTALTASRMFQNLVNQATQIYNQIQAYGNMIQNTLTLPDALFRRLQQDFESLYDIFGTGVGLTGQGIAADREISNRFMTTPEYIDSGLNQAQIETRFRQLDSELKDVSSEHQNLINEVLKANRDEVSKIDNMALVIDGSTNRNELLQKTGLLIHSMIDVLKRGQVLSAKQSELTQQYKETEMDKLAAQEAIEQDYFLNDKRVAPTTP